MNPIASEPALAGLPARLLRQDVLDADALHQALAAIRARHGSLVRHLVQEKLADAHTVAAAVAQEFGLPLLDLDALQPQPEAVHAVGEPLLRKYAVLPLHRHGRRLQIALADPAQLAALEEIGRHTGLAVEAVVVEQDKLERSLDALLATHAANIFRPHAALESFGADRPAERPPLQASNPAVENLEEFPAVRFVDEALRAAIARGASDIHFEPYEHALRVRLRMDGVLLEIFEAPARAAGSIAARLKVLARLNIAERRVPQDGRMQMQLADGAAYDFRVNTCPTLFGEKIVLRLLDASQAQLGIDSLGYDETQKRLFLQALAQPYGMILVTGPTGSGKTVSLYTGLQILNTAQRNVSTAEDPVEIRIAGINQVSIRPRVGLSFAAALRAFLRQDPDVIMVGEIRDLETAEIAIKAAQTGHLVLSTLHTKDAPGSLTRLLDMGIKPYAVAASVTLVVAQRLARRLCPHCKRPAAIPPAALRLEGFDTADVERGLTIYEPAGCARCSDGYKGRTGIFQVMPVSEPIRRLILETGDSLQIAERARREGIADLRASALQKVRAGITSLQEINRVTTD